MSKPRRKKITFPYAFEKNGRKGKIYRWNEKDKKGAFFFGSYFWYAGKSVRNTFNTFEAAYLFLENEFSKLDTDRANSLSLHPLNSDLKTYRELEQLLRTDGDGATLREAVAYYLAHKQNRRFEPKTCAECADTFILHQQAANVTPIQLTTLKKHFSRFNKQFGKRKIHDVTALEMTNWLAGCKDERTEKPWSVKTRTNVIGSLVSLSIFSKEILSAIATEGKTEFQKVQRPTEDRSEVDIYTPEEIKTFLYAAIEHDIDLIPAIVTGCFQGLRPFEFHGEGLKRPPLTWERFNWPDKLLHITGQKVRSKGTRDIPLHRVTEAWLEPFKELTGPVWRYKQAHSKKMIALRKKAAIRSVYDGYRHGYASYRIRQLKGDLEKLAEEMGNSPKEIIDSYKRGVTDAQAAAWFGIMPPQNYAETIRAVLASRRLAYPP